MSTLKSPPVRVLIADRDPLVCRALARLLGNSAGMDIVATSTDRDEVLELTTQYHPAVALVDADTTRLDGLDGINLTRSLSQRLHATRVIVLGVYATMRDQALLAGACRFLLKDCSRDTLVEAIRWAASGDCEANETNQQSHGGQQAGPLMPALH